jgi:hypothetical protein
LEEAVCGGGVRGCVTFLKEEGGGGRRL